ncbi:MAG: hypothetical protein DBX01_05885 [Puniceicoccaceae bacterium]|nr:hypothetical protein [Puniceicoccaceae bacterium]RCL33520.1 MAG: hypothetical protein DBX01_05885 [Puniceicoccaceae bacterium]
MPTIALSGNRTDITNPIQKIRSFLLGELVSSGWEISNSYGDQIITLDNIELKIQEADAFIFMPNAQIEDIFYAVSIFVGYQTLDPDLKGKPAVILNTDGSWDLLFELLDQLEIFGTIRQSYRKFLLHSKEPKEALANLSYAARIGIPDSGRKKIISKPTLSFETPLPTVTKSKVCVFCSASMDVEDYIEDGYALGKLLADHNFGCVSGAGTTGVMGSVVQGSVEAGGWTAGSNVPHIIEIEGLPKGLSSFWLRPDIYTRMEVMIERSDAFIIFPGGAGTVQELLALLIFKQSGNPLMAGKPIVLFNRIDKKLQVPFWGKLVTLLNNLANKELFTVVTELEEIIPTLDQLF